MAGFSGWQVTAKGNVAAATTVKQFFLEYYLKCGVETSNDFSQINTENRSEKLLHKVGNK